MRAGAARGMVGAEGRALAPVWWRFIKFHTKVAIMMLVVFVTTAFTALVGIFRPRNTANNDLAARIYTALCGVIFRIRIDVRGEENLRRAQPCIYVCNHQSSLDVLCCSTVWPKNTAALGKREILFLPVFGQFFYLAGNISIDRARHENAMAAMSKAVQAIREQKRNVWIFPEGTRNREEGMLPFKKGAFHLAVQAQVPVVPVVFSPYHDFYSKADWLFDSGHVNVTVLPPIDTAGLGTADVESLMERTRNAMMAAYNSIAPTAASPAQRTPRGSKAKGKKRN